MIFFVANDGTIVKSSPSAVYQGSEDASSVCVIAPFAEAAQCTAIFKLPNGELKSPLFLKAAGTIEGAVNTASGKAYALWKKDLPEPIAKYYGEVQVQFFFHFADRVVATSTSTFMVGRGVGRVLPDKPSDTIYEDILSAIVSLKSQLDNGSFAARSVYQWNVYRNDGEIPDKGYGMTKTGQYCEFRRMYDDGDDTGCFSITVIAEYKGSPDELYFIDFDTEYAEVGDKEYDIPEKCFSIMAMPAYGVNEIVFYPNIGEFGAFVKSIKGNNCNQVPYINGKLNKEWWAEVVNFNNITEDYFNTLSEIAARAEESASLAFTYAHNASVSSSSALDSKIMAAESAQQAGVAQAKASEKALAAEKAAAQAAIYEAGANIAKEDAENLKNAAADSAVSAKEQAELAASLLEQFASFGIKINTSYSSFDELPNPGNSNNIYFIPNGGEGSNAYDEWVWVEGKNAYEKIGTTEIDLSAYATHENLAAEKEGRITADKALNKRIDEIAEKKAVIPISYTDLVSLRNLGKLTEGTWYRITDYVTTTTQEESQSAGHAFDIIVLALSTDKLKENAFAIQHEGDRYFADSKLEAWQLKYCIDNDADRFAWADTENGKGVIYEMVDEFNNKCGYDFKNIQFKRYMVTACAGAPDLINSYSGVRYVLGTSMYPSGATIDQTRSTWKYTFDNVGEDFSLRNIATSGSAGDYGCRDNEIYPYTRKKGTRDARYLNNVVFANSAASGIIHCWKNRLIGAQIHSSTFGSGCYGNTLNSGCYGNVFGRNCSYNVFGDNCYTNTFGDGCSNNVFSSLCFINKFSTNCSYNVFNSYCYANTLGYGCERNSFAFSCSSNKFDDGCAYNSFHDMCTNNKFARSCHYNTLGSNCLSNTLDVECEYNSIGDRCSFLKFPAYTYYGKFQSVVYFDGRNAYDFMLMFANNSSLSIRVIGKVWNGEYDEQDEAVPRSIDITVPPGKSVSLMSYDDTGYDDGYSFWTLTYEENGFEISTSGDYD